MINFLLASRVAVAVSDEIFATLYFETIIDSQEITKIVKSSMCPSLSFPQWEHLGGGGTILNDTIFILISLQMAFGFLSKSFGS